MIILTIAILTIPKRKEFLDRLLGILRPQETAEVEILINSDDGKKSEGFKRQECLDRAQGQYIAFVDDDDRVSDKYVQLILNALKYKPDVCSLSGIITVDGKDPRVFVHSLMYKSWTTENGVYYRCPNHLNPVKIELAKKTGYKDLALPGTDRDYSMRLVPLLDSEVEISETLYYYEAISRK